MTARSMPARLAGRLWQGSGSHVTVESTRSAEDWLAHLQEALRADPEVNGRVRGRAVQLWRRPERSRSRGSFAPVFYGVVEDLPGGGSRLVGHFQLHPVTRLYVLAWMAAGTLLALGFLIVGVLRASPERSVVDALPFALPALLPLAGLAILRWQQRRGREDEAVIRAWLARTGAGHAPSGPERIQ